MMSTHGRCGSAAATTPRGGCPSLSRRRSSTVRISEKLPLTAAVVVVVAAPPAAPPAGELHSVVRWPSCLVVAFDFLLRYSYSCFFALVRRVVPYYLIVYNKLKVGRQG